MSAVDLVRELEQLGVRLWEDAGQLRFRAPQGVMTEARRDALRRDKAAVLQHLRDSTGQVTATANPEARHDPFPLTDLQHAYVIGRRASVPYGGVACHAYGELAFPDLDPGRIDRAWRQIVRRHDMLRAVIDSDGWQRVLSDPPDYRIQITDVRGADRARVRQALDETRAELDHQVHPLDVWPMFDVRVTRADERAILHLSVDFLIADYVSLQVVLDELRALYRDPDRALPPLGLTFRDYLLAERGVRTGRRYDRDRDYWWARIDALPAAPELPILDTPASNANVRFRRLEARLTKAEAAAFHQRAQQHDITASGALLGAYAEVIACWSRHPRFSLNVTVLQRLPLHPDVDRLVGDFTAIDLLAVDADPSATFRDRASAVQARLWEDLDHRLCSGVEVMRELTRRRGPGAALMPVVYTSAIGLSPQPDAADTPDAAGAGEFVYGISQTPQVWIDCQVMQRGADLVANWDVREGVFPDEVIADMFGAFDTLLHALAASDVPWTSVCPVTLPPAQAARRREVNDTHAPLPDGLLPGLLHGGFLAQAARTPDRPAVIAAGRLLTYGDLLGRARAVASSLTRDGCRAGEIVAVWMEKGLDEIVAVLGILLAGAAYLPIDFDQPRLRRARLLADAGVQRLLTHSPADSPAEDAGLLDGVTRIDVDTLPLDLADPPATMPLARPDDLAYVIYTSGSTGSPKGVCIAHRAALNTIDDINHRFDVTAADRVLGLASLGFDLSVYDVFGTLAAGACLILPDAARRADPSHWAALVSGHGVTIWNSVPAQLHMLDDYLNRAPLSSPTPLPTLRLAMLSGDWIPTALPDRIRARVPGLRVVSLGGATEASIWSIVYPIDAQTSGWRSIPYGKPLANQTFHVLDAALRDRPDWTPGELYIGGAGVALGYLADEAKTAGRFITHPATGERLYRTGDLGRYLPDGNIEFLGREDTQIKIRGHRIELAEVEAALQAHPGVARAAVIVHGDRPLERRLAAFVEPGRRHEPDTASSTSAAASADATWMTDAVSRRAGDLDPAACHDVVYFARALDDTALCAMLSALEQHGLFAATGDAHTLDEILSAARVAPKHHRLVRRWLKALERHRLIERDSSSLRYRRVALVDPGALDAAWRRIDELQPQFDRRTELIAYFRLAAGRLPELLRGELDPMRLLFPEGRVEIHEAAYNDNFLSRRLNTLVTLAVSEIAAAHDLPGPCRVLEAGAGVGGTSVELIPALAAVDATYLFTDVSPFFLNNARERFAAFPWVGYALFDINRDAHAQGLLPNSFDIIVCANVLHYARDAAQVLARIRELLRPGGWLVFIDMARDNYQVLTSMEFLFDATVNDFEDVRAGRDETFIALDQWKQLLTDAGGEIGMCLPAPGDVLAEIGFHVFAARFKHHRAPVHALDLATHLAERLPDYMIPSHVQIVDALPITDNAKIDRGMLRSWIPAAGADAAAPDVEEANSDLERRLAAVWRTVLRADRVGSHQDFFQLGGDSLLAAQLVGRMREEIPEAAGVFFDTLLRFVLDGPTVSKLAAHLEQTPSARGGGSGAAAAATGTLSPLVRLDGVDGGPLRVFVHDASGTLASYAGLLGELGRSNQLAGLVVSDAAYLGTQAAVLVRRTAAAYAKALHAEAIEQIHLIGADVGGVLALEVARHLIEHGLIKVALTVVNSAPVPCLVDDELFAEYLFVRSAGVDPVRLGYPAETALARAIDIVRAASPDRIGEGALAGLRGDAALDGVAWCFRRLAARPVEDRLAAVARAVNQSGATAAPTSQVRALYDVFRHSLRAFALHDVAPYAGDVTLLRSVDATPIARAFGEDPTAFWQAVCFGDLRIVDIEGDALNCLRPPSVAHALKALMAAEPVEAAGA